MPASTLLLAAAVAGAAGHCPLAGAALHARLAGAVAEDIGWGAADMQCEGMRRADGGVRLRFTGAGQRGEWVFVFGIPDVAEGASGSALPVNLTVIAPGGRVYGTRGTDRCTLDDLRQVRLTDGSDGHRWQVEARGFCLGPARAIGGDDALLVTTFELTGVVLWEADPAVPAAAPARASGP